jgi:ATP/maltotriose-dependent transcriptional regulator MalT
MNNRAHLKHMTFLCNGEENFGIALTVVSARAGYGKSSLISHSLDNSNFSGAWLSLDESDTGMRGFLTYFVAALPRSTPCSR